MFTTVTLATKQPPTGRPSKTRLKQQSQDLQDLGVAVAALPQDRLAAIAMPDNLRDAIETYRRTRSHEGRRRQMQYVGKLMRSADEAALREAVAAATLGSARETLALHEAERWRAELVASDDALHTLDDRAPRHRHAATAQPGACRPARRRGPGPRGAPAQELQGAVSAHQAHAVGGGRCRHRRARAHTTAQGQPLHHERTSTPSTSAWCPSATAPPAASTPTRAFRP
jgi:ribosomal 50S subunit-associated protein YjgA (DUF615 family)